MKKIILIVLFFPFSINLYSQEINKFHHVLLYKWKKNIENNKKVEFLKIFEELPNKIEGLSEISINNITKSLENFDLVINFEFTSKSVLKKYQDHKDHNRIVIMAKKIVCDYSYFQYE